MEAAHSERGEGHISIALYGTYTTGSPRFFRRAGHKQVDTDSRGGYSGELVELIVAFGLVSLSIAMITCCVLVLLGLRKPNVG
jgi:hypothetical protein